MDRLKCPYGRTEDRGVVVPGPGAHERRRQNLCEAVGERREFRVGAQAGSVWELRHW